MEELKIENNRDSKPIAYSWKRVFKVTGVIVGIALIAGGAYFFVTWRAVRAAWANIALDRKENYLSCYDLPFALQVSQNIAKHQDVIDKVKSIAGVNDFYAEQVKCYTSTPGTYFIKGDMVLSYQNRQARKQAESLIGKDFFGIPFRGEQVN
ncbi:MAG: hypothetical protein P4L74_07115 [Candidatus Doudnabacteria bacterium]|nr:hypothetical protein [Candidatus Doudnabacteria bacterium]